MTLMEQVKATYSKKIEAQKEDARNCANDDFEKVAKELRNGEAGSCDEVENCIVIIITMRKNIYDNNAWKEAYKSTLEESFYRNGFKKKNVEVTFEPRIASINAVITLKIW